MMGNFRVENERSAIGEAFVRAKVLESLAKNTRIQPLSHPAPDIRASRVIRSSLVAAFVVGTGGLLTADYVTARNDRGYRLLDFSFRGQELGSASRKMIRSPIENLARVRSIFRPTTTELALLLGVSRQAIYNWQSGQPIALQNIVRLEELANSADLLIASGIAAIARPLTRKLPGGKSVFDSICEGSAPDEAVKQLMAMMEREVRQREAISNRLAGRAQKPVIIDNMGAPYLDESV